MNYVIVHSELTESLKWYLHKHACSINILCIYSIYRFFMHIQKLLLFLVQPSLYSLCTRNVGFKN